MSSLCIRWPRALVAWQHTHGGMHQSNKPQDLPLSANPGHNGVEQHPLQVQCFVLQACGWGRPTLWRCCRGTRLGPPLQRRLSRCQLFSALASWWTWASSQQRPAAARALSASPPSPPPAGARLSVPMVLQVHKTPTWLLVLHTQPCNRLDHCDAVTEVYRSCSLACGEAEVASGSCAGCSHTRASAGRTSWRRTCCRSRCGAAKACRPCWLPAQPSSPPAGRCCTWPSPPGRRLRWRCVTNPG